MELPINKIINGNALDVLKTFPDECIDCIVTSPPYWAVRDYEEQNEIIWDGNPNCQHEFEIIERKIHSGNCKDNVNPAVDSEGGYKTEWKYQDKYCKKCNAWQGQLGLEEHPQQYINHIVQILKECKRVLKSTGSIWLNLGDSYYTKSGSRQGTNFIERHIEMDAGRNELHNAQTKTRGKFKSNWLQTKQRLLIPYRIAMACQDELGLILRNDITWVKQILNWKTKESEGTSMPTSVQDRLNTNSEALFFFVKDKNYFFDLDAIRVKHKISSMKRNEYGRNDVGSKEGVSMGRPLNPGEFLHPKGKNPGDCIIFPLEPSSENHYAMFPKTIPEFCIKAGCPKEGIVLDPFMGGGYYVVRG
jgi:DNA modification methylase